MFYTLKIKHFCKEMKTVCQTSLSQRIHLTTLFSKTSLNFKVKLCVYLKKTYLCIPIQKNKSMANHKSALKRIRSNEAKRLRNRYQHKTTRTFVTRLRNTTDKSEAQELLKKVIGMLDKLAKKNIIHKKKASNQKSKLTKLVNGL